MHIDNTFTVTAPLDEVWDTLMAFDRVAGCVPGASVVALTDDTFDVTMRVRVGPMVMQYKGTLEVVERDAAARRAVVRGKAQELKGQGTAEGTIELRLADEGQLVRGECSAEVKLSGRAAAMGKGVISKVAEQLMGQFSANLQTLLNASPQRAGDPGGDPEVPERSGATVVDGVKALAAGTKSEGVLRDPDEATPGTSPVEQVEGDRAMTEGRRGTDSGGGASAGLPAASLRVADEPEALDALALVGSVVRAQLGQPLVMLGLLLPTAVLVGFWLGRRSVRR